jgi:hypothetical protein
VRLFIEKFVKRADFLPNDYFVEKCGAGKINIHKEKEQILNIYMDKVSTSRYSFDIKGFEELGKNMVIY